MDKYIPILKFAHSFTKKVTYMSEDSVRVKTNDDTRMADAIGAAYEAGNNWFVTLADLGHGVVEYQFRETK